MKSNYSSSLRASLPAMEYLKQIRALTAFSSLFDFKADAVKVDNVIFRLQSMVTVFILMVGTMFVTMRQYFGDPIECLTSKSDINPTLLQHYCWLESTFSVTGSNTDAAYPGVKTHVPSQGERKNYHKYYQWVYFVLILQVNINYSFLILHLLLFNRHLYTTWRYLTHFKTLDINQTIACFIFIFYLVSF